MSSQRKKTIIHMIFAAIAYVVNYLIGRDVLAFIGRHIVYWAVSLTCAGIFVILLINLISGEDVSQENDDSEKCPDYVEPMDGGINHE